MADFQKVLEVAQDGYGNRKDHPPYAISPWDDRVRWNEYLKKINAELDEPAEVKELREYVNSVMVGPTPGEFAEGKRMAAQSILDILERS